MLIFLIIPLLLFKLYCISSAVNEELFSVKTGLLKKKPKLSFDGFAVIILLSQSISIKPDSIFIPS